MIKYILKKESQNIVQINKWKEQIVYDIFSMKNQHIMEKLTSIDFNNLLDLKKYIIENEGFEKNEAGNIIEDLIINEVVVVEKDDL